jgi:DNA-directed RNA polymerase subunit L
MFPFTSKIKISTISESENTYKFTLSGVNVSFANSLRRIILSEIPINVIRTETEEINQCKITTNTSRLHNEIIKQRLSCIPIHLTDTDLLPDKYILEVNVENTTDNLLFITTENFKIKNKTSGNYLTKEQTREIFPPNKYTNFYIDFIRLRPKIGDNIPGEKLELTADFSVCNAKVNSMFNVVSICSYSYTPDAVKINEKWEEQQEKMWNENLTKEEIEFKKKNFYILDAQRIFIENSFDFVIQSIGIFTNEEIVKKGCAILKMKFQKLEEEIDTGVILISNSNTTIDNCYDVKLENEDYTIGKALEYVLYEKYYVKEKILSFCGFKKFHPHDTYSKIRIAFNTPTDTNSILNYLKDATVECKKVFEHIEKMF